MKELERAGRALQSFSITARCSGTPTSPNSASAGHEKSLPGTASDLPRKVENRKKSANPTQLLAYHRTTGVPLHCRIDTLYAAVIDWSVRAAPLLLYCCCTAVMMGCDRPIRSVPSLSDRHVPAFLSHRVCVIVLFVLPSSGPSPTRRLATPSSFSVNRSCLATPPSYGHCSLQQTFSAYSYSTV